jgi:hypothetical protein
MTETQKMGILLLNPYLGNYSYISSPDLVFDKGEKVIFLCPVCSENLAAKDINENLVHIFMEDEENKKYDVYFSSIAGEHSTFKIKKDNIIEKYGKDSTSYLNYFSNKLEHNIQKSKKK